MSVKKITVGVFFIKMIIFLHHQSTSAICIKKTHFTSKPIYLQIHLQKIFYDKDFKSWIMVNSVKSNVFGYSQATFLLRVLYKSLPHLSRRLYIQAHISIFLLTKTNALAVFELGTCSSIDLTTCCATEIDSSICRHKQFYNELK